MSEFKEVGLYSAETTTMNRDWITVVAVEVPSSINADDEFFLMKSALERLHEEVKA